MKKKIFGLALIAMSLVAFNGMAQNSSDRNCVKQENVKCCKADRQGRQGKKMNPYEGLTLTDSQKAQLQQLDEKRKAERSQQAQVGKEQKQRNDSARFAARQASRKQYLEDVKAIVGPEQYVVFLENIYVNGGGHDKAIKQGRHGDKSKMAQDRRSNDGRNKDGRKHASNPEKGRTDRNRQS